MSLIALEISLVLERIFVLAPTEEHLHELFEKLHLDLTTSFGAQQKLNLAATGLDHSPLKAWTSFTLGQRGSQELRVCLMGATYASLKNYLNEASVLCDGVWALVNPELKESEDLLRFKVPPALKGKPVVVMGLNSSHKDSVPTLRERALEEWFKRNFPSFLRAQSPDTLLSEGLEWMLSF